MFHLGVGPAFRVSALEGAVAPTVDARGILVEYMRWNRVDEPRGDEALLAPIATAARRGEVVKGSDAKRGLAAAAEALRRRVAGDESRVHVWLGGVTPQGILASTARGTHAPREVYA